MNYVVLVRAPQNGNICQRIPTYINKSTKKLNYQRTDFKRWDHTTPSVQFSSISFIFKVRFEPGPLRCPSLTRLPLWESIPGPLLTKHPSSAAGAQIISCRSDDLVVPKLPACRRVWWWRLVPPSTGGDWWATCHHESCVWYSRLWCDTRVSPLLPPPFTYKGGVLLEHQLRDLCLETELGKKKKRKGCGCQCLFPVLGGTDWELG